MFDLQVAAVAQGFLSPSATQGIANLLPESNGDMSQVASWADSVARNMYPWSPPLHYVNTPDWTCNYDRKRDCSANGVQGFCVDGAIQNFTGQLIAGKAPISLNVALKFVIHFIGDIHQPLHCGFNSDEGGNTIVGTFEQTKGRKLHQVWDNDMVDKRIKEDFSGVNSTYLQYCTKTKKAIKHMTTVAMHKVLLRSCFSLHSLLLLFFFSFFFLHSV